MIALTLLLLLLLLLLLHLLTDRWRPWLVVGNTNSVCLQSSVQTHWSWSFRNILAFLLLFLLLLLLLLVTLLDGLGKVASSELSKL